MIQRAARGTAEKEISPSPRKDRPDSVQVQARKAVERERRSPFSVYIVPKSIHARILQNLRGASVQIQTSTIYPGTICPGHTLPKSTRAQSAHEPVLARSAQALISICPGNFSPRISRTRGDRDSPQTRSPRPGARSLPHGHQYRVARQRTSYNRSPPCLLPPPPRTPPRL
jgi:hypothetical protein